MTKLEYVDRHRFIASIGVALIVLSVIVPWLFLRESFDLLVERDKLAHLTLLAQEVITYRQALVRFCFCALPWLSLLLILTGSWFLYLGLRRWEKKQNIQDRTESLTLAELERRAAQMSQAEVEEKRQEDSLETPTAQVPISPPIELNAEGLPRIILNSKSPDIKNDDQNKYFEIERKVVNQLKNVDPENFELLSQRKIGGRRFDAIVARKTGSGPDVLVEIKHFTRSLTTDVFYRLHDRLVSTTLTYEHSTGRKARGVIIVVVPSRDLRKHIQKTWFRAMSELMKRKIDPSIYLVEENKIENEAYWEMILGDPQINLEEWSN